MSELCRLCPRECGVNRSSGQIGYCKVTDKILVARASLHMWEEPCISGGEGSGAVFFSGCNMGCVFCQNRSISRGNSGIEISVNRLAEIFLELQDKGANNINLVTPTHYTNEIIAALDIAKGNNLNIPVLYNSSGYDSVMTLNRLKGYVDIYLPDCKYFSEEYAVKYSNAVDYFNTAIKAIEEMVRQVGEPQYDNRGIMKKGVIVRHLVLPGHVRDSKKIIESLYSLFGDSIILSIMNQYTPIDNLDDFPELNRKVTKREYERVIDYMCNLGIENAFIQEGDTAKESFIPEFDNEGVEKK